MPAIPARLLELSPPDRLQLEGKRPAIPMKATSRLTPLCEAHDSRSSPIAVPDHQGRTSLNSSVKSG
jgi:hypothetical protein